MIAFISILWTTYLCIPGGRDRFDLGEHSEEKKKKEKKKKLIKL